MLRAGYALTYVGQLKLPEPVYAVVSTAVDPSLAEEPHNILPSRCVQVRISVRARSGLRSGPEAHLLSHCSVWRSVGFGDQLFDTIFLTCPSGSHELWSRLDATSREALPAPCRHVLVASVGRRLVAVLLSLHEAPGPGWLGAGSLSCRLFLDGWVDVNQRV